MKMLAAERHERAHRAAVRHATHRHVPATGATLEREANTTTDLLEIRRWAEKRDGEPAIVKGAASEDETALWIRFPGSEEAPDLEPISWDEWYERFLEKHMVFEYLDKDAEGKLSYFFRLVS